MNERVAAPIAPDVSLFDRRGTSFSEQDVFIHGSAREMLAAAGIQVNGSRPWDIQVRRAGVFERAMAYGNLGLGEAYMDGDWEAECLDEFFARLLVTRVADGVQAGKLNWRSVAVKLFNLQSVRRSKRVGEVHYDLGNDFYAAMLDTRMTYTCGYWHNAENLGAAQEAKLDLICRKLKLRAGMRVLDIGCGWGSFMAFAAEKYGVEAVGVSISREQIAWASKRYKNLPLEFRFQDYREIDETFDAVVSVGMFEHVGRKNHRTFMKTAHRCLRDQGLMLLHTIGKNERDSTPDPWIDRYVFPGGDLPSLGQIGDAADRLFVVEDVHGFGADYDKTLMAWWRNFEAAWPQFEQRLGRRFYRMWRYYLLSCAGAFRARDIQLWQFVMSKSGTPGGYRRELV